MNICIRIFVHEYLYTNGKRFSVRFDGTREGMNPFVAIDFKDIQPLNVHLNWNYS